MSNPYVHVGDQKPYNDDFDPNKNYKRIMFNPARAVQARELTQSQTLLQYQMAAHASYLFKDGTTISGGKIYFGTKGYKLICKSIYHDFDGHDYLLEDSYVNQFIGVTFVGQDSRQKINIVSWEKENGNYVLFFNYLGGPILPGEKFIGTFQENETTSRQVTFDMTNNPVGTIYFATCSPGTIFVNGYFLTIPEDVEKRRVKLGETLAGPIEVTEIDAIGNTVAKLKDVIYSIGFKITQTFMNSAHDITLNDNASGTSNFNAPGADRLKYEVELYAFEGYDVPDEFKAPGTNISYVNGVVVKNGKLVKEQIDPMSDTDLMALLAKRTYDESGSYTINPWKIYLQNNIDSSKYDIAVQEGNGYIYGYHINTIIPEIITNTKPRTTITKNEIDLDTNHGFSFIAQFVNGKIDAYNFPAINEEVNILSTSIDGIDNLTNVNPETNKELIDELIETKSLGTAYIKTYHKDNGNVKIYLYNIHASDLRTAKSLVVHKNNIIKYVNLYFVDNITSYSGNEVPAIYKIKDETKIARIVSNSISYNVTREYIIQCDNHKLVISDDYMDFGNSGTLGSVICIYNNNENRHASGYGEQINLGDVSIAYSEGIITLQSQLFQNDVKYSVVITAKFGHKQSREKRLFTDGEEVISKETLMSMRDSDNKTHVLQKEDILMLNSITYNGIELKNKAVLDNGQRDYYYDRGSVDLTNVIKEIFTTNEQAQFPLIINYSYFTHSSSYGPFTVESYLAADNLALMPNIYEKIPIYQSSNGTTYALRNCVDCRMKLSDLQNANNALSSAYMQVIPFLELEVSYSAYLPRYDIVYVTSSGEFNIARGLPSENPDYPTIPVNAMGIYYIHNSAYVQDLREVQLKYIDNKRYTMNDIAKLDKRVKNAEDAISLSQLELSASNMQILDANGLNRYKTGIFTDNFGSFDNSDYASNDWNCNIDCIEQSLRCNFNCKNFPFEISYPDSGNVTKSSIGLYLTPIGIETYAKNENMSDYMNVQKLAFHAWHGDLTLDPSSDTWVNDLGQFVVHEEFIETEAPVTYKSWTTYTNKQINHNWSKDWGFGKGIGKQLKTTYTAQEVYEGSWIKSSEYEQMESQDEFMRERDIDFELKGFRAGMEIRGSINDVPVVLKNLKDKNGVSIIDNKFPASGFLSGTFTIPPNIPCGVKTVRFVDDDETSSAEATYTANGTTIWTNVYNTYLREWTKTNNLTNQTITSQKWVKYDPVAESIYIEEGLGVYAESFEVCFAQKDREIGAYIYILEMSNGYPDYESIVPYSRVYLDSAEINAPTYEENEINRKINAVANPEYDPKMEQPNTRWTKFKFPMPIFLQGGKEYAFVVATTSYNYEVYISTLGHADLIDNGGIYKQPYDGSLFISQNARTWEPQQQNDLRFKLNIYKWDPNVKEKAIFNLDVSELDTDEEFEVASATLACNHVAPEGTSISFGYKTDETNLYTPYENNDTIDLPQIVTLTRNRLTNISNKLSIQLILETRNPYITPIVDLEQVYAILTNNIVKPLEYYDSNTVKKYDAGTYISKVTTLEQESRDIRVLLDAICPKGSDVSVFVRTTTFKPRYLLQSTIWSDFPNVKIGTNTEDLTTLNGKVLYVYYCLKERTLYVPPEPEITEETGTTEDTGITENTEETGSTEDTGTTENTEETGTTENEPTPQARDGETGTTEEIIPQEPQWIVNYRLAYQGHAVEMTGYAETYENNKKEYRIYLVQVGNPDIFHKEINAGTYDQMDGSVYAILLTDFEITSDISLLKYDPDEIYSEGQFVIDAQEKIWKSLRSNNQNNTPTSASISWEYVPVIKTCSEIIEQPQSEWREMNCTSGTKSSSWNEYTYMPALTIDTPFKSFSIKICMTSLDKINIPRVKNLRAIATV